MPSPMRPKTLVRVFLVTLVTAALVLIAAVAWPPGQARAATDSVTVVNPGAETSNGGLTVTLDSSSALSAVTAHLADSSGTDVLDPALSQTSSTTLASGDIQSVWDVATPIAEGTSPDGIPLGSYAISLDVSFSDGGSASVSGAGTLYFSATPQVTISADHTDVSYADKQVTISGQATQVNPGGTVTPYQGPVYLGESWSPGLVATVTANADGDFSAVVAPNLVYGPSPTVSAQIAYGAPGDARLLEHGHLQRRCRQGEGHRVPELAHDPLRCHRDRQRHGQLPGRRRAGATPPPPTSRSRST